MRVGDKILNYTLTRRIKAGGMGVVFEGEQAWGSRRKVAIKQLLENLRDDETIRRRFIREAEILEMLDDPRIVRILGFDPDQDAFVMEFIEGKTLSDYLRESPAIFRQPGVLVAFMNELLSAFAYAHDAELSIDGRTEKGIVHRDIKPSNIIVQPNGVPKILDFGISRIASFQSTLTDPKLQMGSVPYMSPEQIATPVDVDWRSDIYSLGVTLWEMLTGRSPYPRVTTHEVVVEVQRQIRFEPLPSLLHTVKAPDSEEGVFLRRIDEVIARATSKDRECRYQHCAEMKMAIQQAFNGWINRSADKSKSQEEPVLSDELTEATQLRAMREGNRRTPSVAEPVLMEAVATPVSPNAEPHQLIRCADDLDVNLPPGEKTGGGDSGQALAGRHKPTRSRNLLIGGVAALIMAGGVYGWQSRSSSNPGRRADSATTAPVVATEATLADLALADSCLEVGNTYYYGRPGTSQDYGQALYWYKRAADLGNSDGQNLVGSMYQYGQGTVQNYSQAMTWFRKSAAQSNAEGQKNMGIMYYLGLGVAKNYPEALTWFRASAEQKNAEGCTNLGVMYEHGDGTDADNDEALKWYMKAANLKFARAQYYVGNMYVRGKGTATDLAKAVQWYRLAARQGDASAQQELRQLHQSW